MIIDFLEDESDFNCLNPYLFKFKTNAKNFKIYMRLYEKSSGYYPHFGISAREGILLMYKLCGEDNWYNFDAYIGKTEINVNMSHIVDGTIEYEVMIYGPILSKLLYFAIEIPDEYFGKHITNMNNKKLLVVGGIQSLGIGCTTLGVTFANILSRKFECELYKIAINDNNYLNKLNKFFNENDEIPHMDLGILELDYFSQNDSEVEEYLLNIISHMEKYCDNIICWFSLPETKKYKKYKICSILNHIESDKILIKDLSFLHDKPYYDMCTFSHKFINDAGNILIYKELERCILENAIWNI